MGVAEEAVPMLPGLVAELLKDRDESRADAGVKLADKSFNRFVCSFVECSHDVVPGANLKDFHVRRHFGDVWS